MKRIIAFALFAICIFGLTSCGKLSGLVGNENAIEGITYNGIFYNACGFYCAESDKRFLGYADNGARVYCIGNKNDPDYIIIDGSDNTTAYVKEGVTVPTSGTVTKILIDPYVRGNNKLVLAKKEELDLIAQLTGIIGEVQEFTVENFYTNGNEFYYVYNESNVSIHENYGGYIAFVNGRWIYSAPKNKKERKENNTFIVAGVVIEDSDLISRICETDLVKFIEY